MSELAEMMQEAAEAVRIHTHLSADVGIVLGTGLGALAGEVAAETRVPVTQIPHMARATVQSHGTELIAGKLGGKPVFVMDGRLHCYEGHKLADVVFPVRLLKALGCNMVILSNASGGLNPEFDLGDIMVIDDHINLPGLAGVNPLVGPNDDELGPRFPDMSQPYDRGLIKKAQAAAKKQKLKLRQGVYVMVTGPNLETRAEYRMLRNLGADVVGMSTVPEVIAARHLGMKVAAFSIVTDMCMPDMLEEANIEKIIATAAKAEPKLTKLVGALVASI